HLHLGARILAVADIFSAITEDRPYRRGMEKEKAMAILRGDAERGDISTGIVELLAENYGRVNAAREKASEAAGRRYRESMGQ
nr:phosphohydrolase [Oscillospiraceae bacterium]